MIEYEDDFEEKLKDFKPTSVEEIEVYASVSDPENPYHNKLKSKTNLILTKNNKNIDIYIENFETIIGPHYDLNRNKGYGTILLKELTKRLFELNLASKITKIEGSLDYRDKNYWTISMPMYLKFAKVIIGKDIVCKINDEPINTDNLVNIIQEHVDNKIAVNFEFCKGN